MSDEVTSIPHRTPLLGSVWLYHPRGVKVQLPVPAGYCTHEAIVHDAADPLAAVDEYLAAGWLIDAPGMRAGEEKAEVCWVCRGEQEGDGETTPYLLLYRDEDKWSLLKVYLNDDEQRAAFERAAGMRLTDLPVYIGRDKPERGASRQIDRFIVRVPRPFGVVFQHNPKWKKEDADAARAKGEIYKVPARRFVRWADQPAGTSKPAAGGERQPQQQADPSLNANAFSQWWADFLAPAPPLDALNGRLSDLADIPAGPVKDRIKHAIAAYAKRCGWQFDKQAGRYAEPQPAAAADNEIPF